MALESQFVAIMQADSELMAVLTGGVYAYGELTAAGITQDSTPDAFDSDGYLLPCAIVKQRGEAPAAPPFDVLTKAVAVNVAVEIWLYEDVFYVQIDAAKPILMRLFQGYDQLPDSFEVYLSNVLARQRDSAALAGHAMERLDFIVPFILQAS